jgi:hypothetical protein
MDADSIAEVPVDQVVFPASAADEVVHLEQGDWVGALGAVVLLVLIHGGKDKVDARVVTHLEGWAHHVSLHGVLVTDMHYLRDGFGWKVEPRYMLWKIEWFESESVQR